MVEMKVEQRIIISQPVDEVFNYLSNLENLVEWTSNTIAVKKVAPRNQGVGEVVRCTTRFLGRWMELTLEIIEREQGRYLTFKSIAGSCPSLFCYAFERSKCGGTVLSQEAVVQHFEGVIDQAEPVVSSAFRRSLEFDLQTLKEILETRPVTTEVV